MCCVLEYSGETEEGGLEKQLNWPEILSEVIIALDFESDTEIKSRSSGLAFSFPFRHYQGARELSFLECQKNLESEMPNLFKTQKKQVYKYVHHTLFFS